MSLFVAKCQNTLWGNDSGWNLVARKPRKLCRPVVKYRVVSLVGQANAAKAILKEKSWWKTMTYSHYVQMGTLFVRMCQRKVQQIIKSIISYHPLQWSFSHLVERRRTKIPKSFLGCLWSSILFNILGLCLIPPDSGGSILIILDLDGFLWSNKNNFYKFWGKLMCRCLRMRSCQWNDKIEFSDMLSRNQRKTEFALDLMIFARGIERSIFARSTARG